MKNLGILNAALLGIFFAAMTYGAPIKNPSNGHYYDWVASADVNWFDALSTAARSTFNGTNGYLATITSFEENEFIRTRFGQAGWLGGNDVSAEGEWSWVAGPEQGAEFWRGGSAGEQISYANWGIGEPNNGSGNEHYLWFQGTLGTWNDHAAVSPNHDGFYVEYGTGGDSRIEITAIEKSGSITWNNVDTSYYYRIEWSADLTDTNSWSADYANLVDLQSSGISITNPIPMYFRVVGSTQQVFKASSILAGSTLMGVEGTHWEGNRFDVSGGGLTLIDHMTGLEWPRDVQISGDMNWFDAVNFANNLDYAGSNNWELPTRFELEGLFTDGRNPADNLKKDFSPITNTAGSTGYFWSSTEPTPDNAYRVGFGVDSTHSDSKTATDNRVFPVRRP